MGEKQCLEIFEKTKAQIEAQCEDLNEMIARIYRFITELQDWQRSKKKVFSGKKISKEKGPQRFLDLARDVQKSEGYAKHKEEDTKKKLAKVIKADKQSKKDIKKIVKKAVEK